MAEVLRDFAEEIPEWARWIASHVRLTLLVLLVPVVMSIVGIIALVNVGYLEFTGDTIIEVKGSGNTITVPRAPQAITVNDIACKGIVDPPTKTRMNGYRATYSVRDAANIVTLYSMILTLDDQGQPRDAYSVVWEYGDGALDARDQLSPPVILPTTDKSLECIRRAGR